jgi:hypothetical protein
MEQNTSPKRERAVDLALPRLRVGLVSEFLLPDRPARSSGRPAARSQCPARARPSARRQRQRSGACGAVSTAPARPAMPRFGRPAREGSPTGLLEPFDSDRCRPSGRRPSSLFTSRRLPGLTSDGSQRFTRAAWLRLQPAVARPTEIGRPAKASIGADVGGRAQPGMAVLVGREGGVVVTCAGGMTAE